VWFGPVALHDPEDEFYVSRLEEYGPLYVGNLRVFFAAASDPTSMSMEVYVEGDSEPMPVVRFKLAGAGA